uniref:SOS response-associated peptidase n=1 Tax=Trichocoleus desertorum TaxID=1481672 RepID=UPI0025B4CA22|nr:SOS response-associated peptidase [Trichocoleus desertorum]
MCGRFTQSQSATTLAATFQLSVVPDLPPRYNIAPTQPVTAVLATTESASNQTSEEAPDRTERQMRQLRWGLIPSWAKDMKMGAKMINARAETVAEKPAFRSAFRQRRCLIVADGFYEWQRLEGKKQPFYFRFLNQQPFAFAGLWEHWQSPEGESIDSCTILTTQANELLSTIHDRMPVILPPSSYDLWLDPAVRQLEPLQPLLQPYPAETMTAYPVSTKVNSPAYDHAECINSL